MVAITPPVLLPADPNPSIQRYGLFNVINGPLDMPDVHARVGGVRYVTPHCSLPEGYEVNCIDDLDTKNFTDGLSVITGTPFVVIAEILCGTIGYSQDEWAQMVFDKLRTGEQAIVEQIFSTATFGQTPSLANDPNAVQLADTTSIAGAIGLLEGWLYARYGPTGILHIPISAAAYVLTSDYVTKESGVWRTKNGTAVSFGNYAGQDTDGADPAAGDTNFYITGQMTAWRTSDADVFISPYGASIDKVHNQIRMYAEREYVLAYDCYAAATTVTLEA